MALTAARLLNITISVAGAAMAGPAGAVVGKIIGSVLEATLPGMGEFIAGFSSNLATDAIKTTGNKITSCLTESEKQRINHDLQIAFQDACREALYDIGGKECFPKIWQAHPRDAADSLQFPRTAAGYQIWRVGSPLVSQTADFLRQMEQAVNACMLIPMDPLVEQPAANVDHYLQSQTPEELNKAFFCQVIEPFLARYQSLRYELPALERHLEIHLLDRTLVHLGEILKNRTPAWRAFNRAILEGLRLQVTELSEGQGKILSRLDALTFVGNDWQQADHMAELLSTYGRLEKNLTQGLNELGVQALMYHRAEMERLEILAASTQRIESKVERVLRFFEDGDWVIEGPVPASADEQPEPGESPFKGMHYFDEKDASLFFGREQLTARLAGRLANQSLLIVTGASGSGKSSLVRAGLVPALRAGTVLADGRFPPTGAEHWSVFVITPTAHPIESMATQLTCGSESVRASVALADDLRADPRSLEFFARRLAEPGRRVLLIIDQFEELFTLCHDLAERQAFLNALLEPSSRGTESIMRIVLTMRADFYASCAQYTALREALSKWQEYIGPMDPIEIRRAIEEPARLEGWSFEPGLVDLILHDVGAEGIHPPEPGALPLLSHALLETWKHRRGRTMTLESYAESGGVRRAIAHTAESVYQGRLDETQRTVARRIFLRLTELGEGTQDTRRRAKLEDFSTGAVDAEAIATVLSVLTEARLVTTTDSAVEVAHEALIREWPTLRQWLEDDRESIRIHRRLMEAAEEWQRGGQDESLLYRGARLVEALEWAAANVDDLNAQEVAFLDASQAFQKNELYLAHERAKEQAQIAARMRRRSMYLAGALLIAAVLATLAMLFWQQSSSSAQEAIKQQHTAEASNAEAIYQKQQAVTQQSLAQESVRQAQDEAKRRATAEASAQRQAEIATGDSLGHMVQTFLDRRHSFALLLSLQASRLNDSPTSRIGLFNSLRANPNVLRYFDYFASTYTDTETGITFSPDNRVIAMIQYIEQPARVKVWDIPTGNLIHMHTFEGDGSLAFLDNNTLSVLNRFQVSTVDIPTGKKQDQILPEEVSELMYSPDGQMFVSLNADNSLKVWDTRSAKILRQFQLVPPKSSTEDVVPNFLSPRAISPNNQIIVVSEVYGGNYTDSLLRLINLENGSNKADIPVVVQTSRSAKVAFDPTTTYLAVGEAEVITIYNLSTMETIETFTPCAWGNQLVFISQDVLICNDHEKLNFWNIQTGYQERTIQGGYNRWSGNLVLNNNNTIGAFSLDDTIALLDMKPSSDGWTAANLESSVKGLRFTPDGLGMYATTQNGDISYSNLKNHIVQKITTSQVETSNPRFDRQTNAIDSNTELFARFTTNLKLHLVDLHRGSLYSEVDIGIDWDDKIIDYSIDAKKGWIVVITEKQKLLIWDYRKHLKVYDKIIELGNPYGDWLTVVAISPDATQVAVGNYDQVNVLDIGRQKFIFTTTHEHTNDVTGIVYAPDGKRFASFSTDGSIAIWDSKTGKQIGKTILSDYLTSLVFSPDGRFLASGSTSVTLWNIETGLPIGSPLIGLSDYITLMSFSSDGRYLAAADQNGQVIVWDLGLNGLRSQACYIANRELNAQEQSQFMGSVEWASGCPDGAQGDIDTGWWLYQDGLYDLAIPQFSAAIMKDSNSYAAYLGRAWGYYQQHEWDQAIADFDQVIVGNPDLLDATDWYAIAQAQDQNGQKSRSIESLNRAIEDAPALACALIGPNDLCND